MGLIWNCCVCFRGVSSQVLGSFFGYQLLLCPLGQEKVLWGGIESLGGWVLAWDIGML